MTSQIVVIDPITDATETGDAIIAAAGSKPRHRITDQRIIRALYDSPSATSYGEGSYTVSESDYRRAVENENGYVIYPDSIGIMDLDEAKEFARESSLRFGAARVESCDDEAVVARYRNGEEQ